MQHSRCMQARSFQQEASFDNFEVSLPMTDFSSLSFIIPTLNEVHSIGLLLGTLVKFYPDAKIIIVDDHSCDGTEQVVQSFRRRLGLSDGGDQATVAFVDRKDAAVTGITASVLDGVRMCTTPYFVVMDADFQHPPNKVVEILQLLKKGADIVVACRNSTRKNRPFMRGAMSTVATHLARTYLYHKGIRVSDPLSGFFGAKTSTFQSLIEESRDRFESGGYKVLFDALKLVHPCIKISECFYSFGQRPNGRSKLRGIHVLYFLRGLFH